MNPVIRSSAWCFKLWAHGLRRGLYPVLYLAGGRLGEKPESYGAGDRGHSRLFMVCRGMLLGLWLRWLENTTSVSRGENEGSRE